MLFQGWSQQTQGAWIRWRERFEWASAGQLLPEPEAAKFKPRFPKIPERECYKEPAEEGFWEKFPANRTLKAVPGMSSKAFRDMVSRYGTSDQARVDRVIGYIEKGADIGCRGI